MKEVSVYILSYNGAGYLARCIEAVLKQTYPVNEIIVIDDGSTDKTSEVASRFPIKLIRHKYNKGIAAARNTAVLEARNEFVASVDTDCLLEPRWLKECMKNFGNLRVAAVGGRLIEKNTKNIEDRWRAEHLKHHWGAKLKVNPIFLSGSNVVIRKEVFKQVGSYDEKRFKKNYEDVDLSSRLKEKGFDLIYEPQALARHIRKDTITSILRTNWTWKFHDCEHRYIILRLLFYLISSLKLISEDISNRRFEFIFIDILTFPSSVYFDFLSSPKLNRPSRKVQTLK